MADDLISRQAAIDMLKNRWKKTRNYEGIGDDIAEECELYLKQVPSALPSATDTNVVTTDTISRQAAIDEIKAVYEWHDTVTVDRLIQHFKALPTVYAVPVVHGKWVDENGNRPYGYRFNWLCSECGRPQHTSTAKLLKEFEEEHRWCHFCGAQMDGDHHEG